MQREFELAHSHPKQMAPGRSDKRCADASRTNTIGLTGPSPLGAAVLMQATTIHNEQPD